MAVAEKKISHEEYETLRVQVRAEIYRQGHTISSLTRELGFDTRHGHAALEEYAYRPTMLLRFAVRLGLREG